MPTLTQLLQIEELRTLRQPIDLIDARVAKVRPSGAEVLEGAKPQPQLGLCRLTVDVKEKAERSPIAVAGNIERGDPFVAEAD